MEPHYMVPDACKPGIYPTLDRGTTQYGSSGCTKADSLLPDSRALEGLQVVLNKIVFLLRILKPIIF